MAKHWIEIDTKEMVMVAIWTMSAHFSMSGQKAKDLRFIFKEGKTKRGQNCATTANPILII